MENSERRLLKQVLRMDLSTFVHRTFQTVVPGKVFRNNWHVDAMCWRLMQASAGRCPRLIVSLPPRYLKSICASVAYPAWVLANDPTKRIVCVSYAEELTSKLAMDTRVVMNSAWYQSAFPATRISPLKNREMDFVTTAGGGRFATTVFGALTGRGGDIIIVDDPMKPADAMSDTKRRGVQEWWDRTIPSRLDDKGAGVIIVVGQRLHLEDLAGHLIAKEEGWDVLSLPAIAEVEQKIPIGKDLFYERRTGEVLHPEHESAEVLAALRASHGSYAFSAQYQQCPLPAEGELIKWKWFPTYVELPPRGPGDMVIQSWDTASKAAELSDYSACTTSLAQGERNYLIDITRERLVYPDLRRRIIEHARAFGATVVLIEDKGSGTSLLQDLAYADEMSGIDVIGVTPVDDKVTRMATQSIAIEAGKVLLPEHAPWIEEFKKEVLQFPKGTYDDQVDSLSQLLGWRHYADHVGAYL